ncbi:MAG: metallophosphoesterase family protein [Candidatus Woesearchaeota archaeon]
MRKNIKILKEFEDDDIKEELITYTSQKEFSKIIETISKNNIDISDLEKTLKKVSEKKQTEQVISLGQSSFYYAYFSDAHIGHKMFNEKLFAKFLKIIKQRKVDFVLNIGDTLEGMSGREGHVYELNQIGFEQQFKYAISLLQEIEVPVYAIDGNHDMWYYNKSDLGIIVGKMLEEKLGKDKYSFLGQMEGELLVDKIRIMLYHANDRSSYGASYQIEKLIDSLEARGKPNIVHSGHYHKYLYIFRRNIHGFESGSLCNATPYMRGKKIVPNVGFGLVRVYHNKQGEVTRIHEEFYTE